MRDFLKWIFNTPAPDHITPETQNLIEGRIESEIKHFERFANLYLKQVKDQQEQFERKVNGRVNLTIAAIGISIGLFTWLVLPIDLEKAVYNTVIKKGLEKSIDDMIQTKASAYVDKSILPLKSEVDSYDKKISQIDALSKQIALLQSTISQATAVSEDLKAKTDSGEQQVSTLTTLVSRANATLDSVQSQENIIALITKVDHDDRPAFDQLLAIAKDPTSPYTSIASEVVVTLVSNSGMELEYTPPWEALGVTNPDSLSLDDLKKLYSKQLRSDFKKAFISYIWTNAKFKKYDRMEFLMSVIKTDQSITTVIHAMELSDADTKIKQNMLNYPAYLAWWDINKATYPGSASK